MLGWALVLEPLGRAGGMLPTARIGPSGLPSAGQTVKGSCSCWEVIRLLQPGNRTFAGEFPCLSPCLKIPHQPPVKLSLEKLRESHFPPSSTQVELHCSETSLLEANAKTRAKAAEGGRWDAKAEPVPRGTEKGSRWGPGGRDGAAMSPPLAQEGSFPGAGL